MGSLFAAFSIFFCAIAAAQDYPVRTVHLIVPYTPGTGADTLARMLGARLAETWKVGVITENKTGATGNIGAAHVAKSAPDGYTLLFVATSFGTTPAVSRAPFDPVKDFAPVALVATSGLVIVANPRLAARTMREFIELAKREPGKLHYSSPGNGGPQHLAMELLKLELGLDIVHVPYRSAAPAISDVVGGHVHATIAAVQTAQPQIASGQLRALAVMSAERSQAFAQVPTMKEQGMPELEVETWYGAFAPAGTPVAVVSRVNADINSLLKEAAIREMLAKQGMAAKGGPPERLGELLKRELARWKRVVDAAGIKAD